MQKYELYTYDVWGNDDDGYEVNNVFSTGDFLELSGNESDSEIMEKLIDAGFANENAKGKISFEGESEYTLYASWECNMKPAFELRTVED